MLAEIERLPQKEVAARQGVTLTCAKSRIQRGRILLRQTLFSCCHIELDHQGCMLDCEPKPETLDSITHEKSLQHCQ
jgi:RNA polymerase sigma-70 factor (ECF subfamily)